MKVSKRLIFLFLAPATTLYFVFFLTPTIYALRLSLFDWRGFGNNMEYVGLRNYEQLLVDRVFWRSFNNTVLILIVGGIIVFGIAFAMTMMLSSGIRGKKLFRAIIFLPNVIAIIALTTLWGYIYTPNFGLLGATFKALGFNRMATYPWLGPDTIIWAMMAAIVWIQVGFFLVLLLAGVDKIPNDYYEAARLDGATQFQMFRQITVPLLWDVITVGMVLWAIYAVKIFEFPFSFTGLEPNVNSYTMAVYLYIQGFGQRQPIYRLGYATAIGVVLLLIVIVVVGSLRFAMRREQLEY